MIKNISLQALAFFLLFHLISWFREYSLLDNNTMAPAFNLPTVSGKTFSNEMLIGKPTVLFFWAPWCSVCKVSMPNLQSFYELNFENVNVISIALDYQSKQEVIELIAQKSLTFPTLYGNSATSLDYKIKGFPTYYVIDRQGQVHAKSMGYSSEIGIKARTLNL